MILEKAGLELAKKLCEDDPVRKNIPYDWRVDGPNREIFHLEEKAVLCVAHLNAIPITEKELMSFGWGNFSIFYTVWSKEKGLGRKIILEVWDLFKKQHTENRYVYTNKILSIKKRCKCICKINARRRILCKY